MTNQLKQANLKLISNAIVTDVMKVWNLEVYRSGYIKRDIVVNGENIHYCVAMYVPFCEQMEYEAFAVYVKISGVSVCANSLCPVINKILSPAVGFAPFYSLNN